MSIGDGAICAVFFLVSVTFALVITYLLGKLIYFVLPERILFSKQQKIRHLEEKLYSLVSEYRTVRGKGRKAAQERIGKEYLATFEELYALGWDEFLDITALLPDPYVPQRYLDKYPVPDDIFSLE